MASRYSLMTMTAAVLLLGCSARINSVVINRHNDTKRWDIDNIFLSKDIEIRDVKEDVKDGMLFVNILVKNGWAMPIGGKLKVLFYDQNGVQLDDPWGWHQINLESSQEEWFKFMAPKKAEEISKMKIMVRGINRYSSAG